MRFRASRARGVFRRLQFDNTSKLVPGIDYQIRKSELVAPEKGGYTHAPENDFHLIGWNKGQYARLCEGGLYDIVKNKQIWVPYSPIFIADDANFIVGADVIAPNGWYGDGSDGAYVLDGTQPAVAGLFSKVGGTYRQLRDAYFTTLQIDNGITYEPNGYRIYCLTALILNGIISMNGGDGGDGGDATLGTIGVEAGLCGTFGIGGRGWINRSISGSLRPAPVNGATNTTPIVLNMSPGIEGDCHTLIVEDVTGNTNANGEFFVQSIIGGAQFNIWEDIHTLITPSGNGAYAGGGIGYCWPGGSHGIGRGHHFYTFPGGVGAFSTGYVLPGTMGGLTEPQYAIPNCLLGPGAKGGGSGDGGTQSIGGGAPQTGATDVPAAATTTPQSAFGTSLPHDLLSLLLQRIWTQVLTGGEFAPTSARMRPWTLYGPSSGGACGAGGAAKTMSGSPGFGGSGGGGGGAGGNGGPIWIAAYRISGSGSIESKGGKGGDGGDASPAMADGGLQAYGGGGGGGEGGGGCGGPVFILTTSMGGGITISLTGGLKGVGGVGSAGADVGGAHGNPGTDAPQSGENGKNGVSIIMYTI